jgi:hypothetical protein
VLIDGTLLKSTTSKSSHGISSAVSTHDPNTVTFASSANGKTHIHVLYASTADDLFAVKLALQFAQNEAVVLTITKLTAAASVSQEDAHVNDTSFQDLKAHGVSLAVNEVVFNTVDGSIPSDEMLGGAAHSEETLFIVGRSTTGGVSGEIARARSNDSPGTLGVPALGLIGKIKTLGLDASVLVVQGRVESSGT